MRIEGMSLALPLGVKLESVKNTLGFPREIAERDIIRGYEHRFGGVSVQYTERLNFYIKPYPAVERWGGFLSFIVHQDWSEVAFLAAIQTASALYRENGGDYYCWEEDKRTHFYVRSGVLYVCQDSIWGLRWIAQESAFSQYCVLNMPAPGQSEKLDF